MTLPPPPYEAPGWYADPKDGAKRRWWNGVEWTSDYQTDAATPQPAAAPPAQLTLAEIENRVASLPGVAGRRPETLKAARASVTRAVSVCLAFGLAASILAAASLGDPGVLTVLAGLAALLAYGSAVLFARLRFLRTRPNVVLAVLGTFLASCALCVAVLTVTFGWRVHFGTGQATSGVQNAPGEPINAPQIHASEHAVLVKIVAAWNAKRGSHATWPTDASVARGVVVSSYGPTNISVPAGYTLDYTVTPDGLGYSMTITDPKGVGEMYDQEQGDYSPTS